MRYIQLINIFSLFKWMAKAKSIIYMSIKNEKRKFWIKALINCMEIYVLYSLFRNLCYFYNFGS